MALGKNLKKQQLISKDKKAPKASQKKVVKKTLIKKAAAKKSTSLALANYISEKELERKKQLRARYKKELESQKEQLLQFVVLRVGAEEYAMDISSVKEVVVAPELAEAPDTPVHIPGLASIRGKTFLAMDLAVKFKKKSSTDHKYFLAVNNKKSSVGFILDSLPVTLKTSGNTVSSDLSMLDNTTKDVTYIKGIIQIDERIIFYLDIDELIASDNAIVVPDELLS